ncbi:hypothetical protein [Lentibacillus jeotgali]|uniref:hypothetical protein n=1 Tax=Lentibacillus jeotgali TaxID=558169 RepID=UPI000262704B|nr:hypothetical protein [Lentibacillus jeotgali]
MKEMLQNIYYLLQIINMAGKGIIKALKNFDTTLSVYLFINFLLNASGTTFLLFTLSLFLTFHLRYRKKQKRMETNTPNSVHIENNNIITTEGKPKK